MIKTRGIVFRHTRYKESSLILDIFTEEAGLQSFIANGVFSKSNQRLTAALQPMNIVELVAYYNEQKELHRLKEVCISVMYQKIPFDIKRSAMGLFLLEVSRKSIRSHHANLELFHFIKNAFEEIDQTDNFNPNFHLEFLIQLMSYLGFQPQNNYSSNMSCFDMVNGVFTTYRGEANYHLSEGASKIFSEMLSGQSFGHLFQNSQQRRQMLHALILYYQLHLENFGQVKSMEVFHEILGA